MFLLYVAPSLALGITGATRATEINTIFKSHTPVAARIEFNTFSSTVLLVAGYAGPGLGGILLPWLGPSHLLYINAASNLFPLALSVRMPTVAPQHAIKSTGWHHYRDRWQEWWAIDLLRWAISLRCLRLALSGGVTAILILYLRSQLGLSSTWIGLAAMTSGLIPLVIGGRASSWLLRAQSMKVVLGCMLVLASLGYGALAMAHTWWQVALSAGIVESTLIPESALTTTLMQKYVPTAHFAETTGLIGLFNAIGTVVFIGTFASLTSLVPFRFLIATATLLLFVAAGLVFGGKFGRTALADSDTLEA